MRCAGDDILLGDAGYIVGTGRGGDDILLGGEGNDHLYGDAFSRFFTVGGFQGNPPVEIPDTGMVDLASGGDDYLDGGAGNDTIVGDALLFSTFVFGIGSFGPSARGSGGVDTLIGGAGDDILIGDAYGIFGTASGRRRPPVWAAIETTFSQAIPSAATFTSTPPFAGDNGRGGNDRLFGEAGDDTLRGGSGNDILDGGDGMDTAVFDGNLADYTVTASPDGSQSIVTEIATGDTDVLLNV